MPSIIRVELPNDSPHGESFNIESEKSFRQFVRSCNRMQHVPAGVKHGELFMIPSKDVVRLRKIEDS